MQDYLGHLLCLFHGERRVSVCVPCQAIYLIRVYMLSN